MCVCRAGAMFFFFWWGAAAAAAARTHHGCLHFTARVDELCVGRLVRKN